MLRLPLLSIFLLSRLHLGWCICYFPGEIQGRWEMQVGVGVGVGVRYHQVDVDADTISGWGLCHVRLDDNIILHDRSVSSECYRCIRLEVVSGRVLQVWSLSPLHTCYTSDHTALQNCPTYKDVKQRKASHFMLYKTVSVSGEAGIEVMECPFNGRFTFTYQRRRGRGDLEAASCPHPISQFSNCPHGFGYEVIYRQCSFSHPQRGGLQCLGSWGGHDGRHYFAVWDTTTDHDHTHDHTFNNTPPATPKYKCGMFLEEAGTGRIFVAFSEDSTCENGLSSPTDGYETYALTSVQPPPLPPDVTSHPCTFPSHLLGHWHHTLVTPDTMVFKDYRNYKTYSASCVKDLGDGERFIVYARSHCGEWSYNCLWLKRRATNVLEFMMGLYPREALDEELCDFNNFGDQTSWITQAKSVLEASPSCPVVGGYSGELPDASGICAHLRSDCAAPQLMYYQVAECRNRSAVYEEREYQCLGQWEEEGRMYALTYRRDVKTYECFVGVVGEGGDVIFIKEAGMVCSRGIRPEVLGMKMHRIETCPLEATFSVTQSSQRSDQRYSSFASTRTPWQITTKPWKPITGRPRQRGSGGGKTTQPALLLFTFTLLLNAPTALTALWV